MHGRISELKWSLRAVIPKHKPNIFDNETKRRFCNVFYCDVEPIQLRERDFYSIILSCLHIMTFKYLFFYDMMVAVDGDLQQNKCL